MLKQNQQQSIDLIFDALSSVINFKIEVPTQNVLRVRFCHVILLIAPYIENTMSFDFTSSVKIAWIS